MTAVTLVEDVVTKIPGVEVVTVTATDGYTYTSKKFAVVKAVIATFNADSGSLSIPIGVAISTNTLTLHATGMSGEQVCLMLFGHSGN